MRNQPSSSFFEETSGEPAELGSAGRFYLLLLLFCGMASVVVARTGWIQRELPAAYLAALNVTTTEYELIAARDGRILTDTSVLAADEDLYSVEVHYRWLEDPVSTVWISRWTRDALTAKERRDSDLVQQTQQAGLQQRDQLWKHLAQAASVTVQDLAKTRQQIQKRVERIAAAVNRRHRERLQPEVSDEVAADTTDGLLMRLASRIRSAVTTPPRRMSEERIVVREEEDYHVVLRDVPLAVAAAIRSHPEQFPGTRVSVATRRTYPQGPLAAHMTGARTVLKEEELQELDPRARRSTGGWIPRRGRSGVEYSWDHRLSGTAGLRRTVRNRRQQIVETSVVRAPAAGGDVVLTIDSGLQRHVEQLLAEALGDVRRENLPAPDEDDAAPQRLPFGAAAVVMDVDSGRVLAAASAPGFDLSLFVDGTQEQWEAVNGDRRQPFLSRISSMALPPGSVFKPVTAAAAIETGTLDPDASFYCQGYLNNPQEHRCLIFRTHGSGHEYLTLSRALGQSCNVYFFSAAAQAGTLSLFQWCRRFGFGSTTGIDLPFERAGTLPTPPAADSTAEREEQWRRETLGLAIGQSRLTATPLQIVRLMGAIANGGWLVVPHVVSTDGVARTADDINDAPRDLARRKVPGLRAETLDVIREGLEAVVEQPWGTAYRTVRLDDIRIAGKSGTAEAPGGRGDHAWFAGYVPVDRPRYAFAVVLEHGGSGSRAAGPVVQEIVRYMTQHALLGDVSL